jgi:hypothetical protein
VHFIFANRFLKPAIILQKKQRQAKTMLPQLRWMALAAEDLVPTLLRRRAIPPKRLVVDFSSPNAVKTFHMGNLRFFRLNSEKIDKNHKKNCHEKVQNFFIMLYKNFLYVNDLIILIRI